MTGWAVLLGVGAGAGVVLVTAGLQGHRPPALVLSSGRARAGRAAAALALGVVVLTATGWPVLAVLTTATVAAVPRMTTGTRQRAAVARSEGVAQWTEMLRDTMAGAAGLEEAIIIGARRPPPAIAGPVHRLAARLGHQPAAEALRRFAADVDDPTADLLAAALITATTNETRNLGGLLAALVEATRAQVAMRETIGAGRAQVRSATRLVIGIAGTFTTALLLFSADYLAPYATVAGQLWLAVVGTVVAASLVLLTRLDRIDLPATALTTGDDASPRPGLDP